MLDNPAGAFDGSRNDVATIRDRTGAEDENGIGPGGDSLPDDRSQLASFMRNATFKVERRAERLEPAGQGCAVLIEQRRFGVGQKRRNERHRLGRESGQFDHSAALRRQAFGMLDCGSRRRKRDDLDGR